MLVLFLAQQVTALACTHDKGPRETLVPICTTGAWVSQSCALTSAASSQWDNAHLYRQLRPS